MEDMDGMEDLQRVSGAKLNLAFVRIREIH
jgi:hypothetical protein